MEAITFTRSMSIAEFKTLNGIDSVKVLRDGDSNPFFRYYKDGQPVLDPADSTKQLGGRCSLEAFELATTGHGDQIEVCWYQPEGSEPSWLLKKRGRVVSISL